MNYSRRRIVSILIVLLLCVLSAEAAMRLAGSIQGVDYTIYDQKLTNSDRLPEQIRAKDELLKHSLRSDTKGLATTSDFSAIYRINSNGLRDEEYQENSQKLTFLAFGDSITFGEGVSRNERFTEVIERKSNVQMLNYGVPGYGIGQNLLHYYRDGELSADNVYLFLTNAMVYRNKTYLGSSKNLSDLVEKESEFKSSTPESSSYVEEEYSVIGENSYLLSYLSYRYKLWKLQEKMRKHDKEQWSDFNGASSDDLTAKEIRRSKRLVKKFDGLAERRGHELKVVNVGPSNLSYLNMSEINYYSIRDELRSRNQSKNLRFTYDPHYNPSTHRFIGNKLSEMENVLG